MAAQPKGGPRPAPPRLPTPGSAEGDAETVEQDLASKRKSKDDPDAQARRSPQNEWADEETRKRRPERRG